MVNFDVLYSWLLLQHATVSTGSALQLCSSSFFLSIVCWLISFSFFLFRTLFLLVYMLIEKFHAMHQILFFLFLSFFSLFTKYLLLILSRTPCTSCFQHVVSAFIHHFSIYILYKGKERVNEFFFPRHYKLIGYVRIE